jgi:hypothetical protein
MSTRQAIITELRARLARISTANGFQTNSGQLVFLAENPMLGEADPEAAIWLRILGDIPGHQMKNIVLRLPVEVCAIAKANLSDPWSTVEAVIADLKTGVERDRSSAMGEPDHSFGGLLAHSRGLVRGSTTPLPREDGSTFVGASVGYGLDYVERWGTP